MLDDLSGRPTSETLGVRTKPGNATEALPGAACAEGAHAGRPDRIGAASHTGDRRGT
jgi:hypothetical protein